MRSFRNGCRVRFVAAFVSTFIGVSFSLIPAAAAPAPRFFELCTYDAPCISRAANGARIELVGYGVLEPESRTASGGGTIVLRSPDGAKTGSSPWVAHALQSFRSWGADKSIPLGEGGLARVTITFS